jgi:hypothetical protein
MDATDEIEVSVNYGFYIDGCIVSLVHLCPGGFFVALWNEI